MTRRCALPGDRVTEPDDDLGVKESPVVDKLIVDPRAWDDSDEPRAELRRLSPGDAIMIAGEEATVGSVGKRSNFGQEGLYSITFGSEFIGTVCTLWVDRDPYLLDVTNGPILTLDPDTVAVNRLDEETLRSELQDKAFSPTTEHRNTESKSVPRRTTDSATSQRGDSA